MKHMISKKLSSNETRESEEKKNQNINKYKFYAYLILYVAYARTNNNT